MASELFYLGILFTITLSHFCAQGTVEHNKAKGKAKNNTVPTGLSLVPGPDKIYVPQKIPVQLNCSITLTNDTLRPLKFTWYKDGTYIDVDRAKWRAQVETRGTQSTLLMQPPGRKRNRRGRRLDGLYECRVKTNHGVVLARRVRVQVIGVFTNTTLERTVVQAFVGGVARFTCDVPIEPSSANVLYIWHKGNQAISEEAPRFTYLPSGVLHISDVEESDAGDYWCQATPNIHGNQQQLHTIQFEAGNRMQLKVTVSGFPTRPPVLVASPKDTILVIGQTAVLECLADGFPAPTITWRKKNNDNSTPLSGYNLLGSNLQIRDVTEEDTGEYECFAAGPSKTLRASAKLDVMVPPRFTNRGSSQKVTIAKTLTYSVDFEGNPPPKVTFYWNGQLIPRTNEHSVTINEKNAKLFLYYVVLNVSGFYQCVLENDAGQAIDVIHYEVFLPEGSPKEPTNLTAKAVNSTHILINFYHEKPEDFHTYHARYMEVEGTSKPISTFCGSDAALYHQCYVPGYGSELKPYTKYMLRVSAVARRGISTTTPWIFVQTLEGVPKLLPQLTLSSPDWYTLLVSWEPLSQENLQGVLIGYRIYYGVDKGAYDYELLKEVGPSETSHLITGVNANTTYKVIVLAGTKVGYTLPVTWKWTILKIPPATAMSPPHLEVAYAGSSSAQVTWRHLDKPGFRSDVISYIVTLLKLNGDQFERVKTVSLQPDQRTFLLSELDLDTDYEVSLSTDSNLYTVNDVTRKFKLRTLRLDVVAPDFQVCMKDAHTADVLWSPVNVPGMDVEYEVCFRKEKEIGKLNGTCFSRPKGPLELSGLEPSTHYEVNLQVIVGGQKALLKNSILNNTLGDTPSAPVNFTLGQVSPGVVELRWLPPLQANGEIEVYVINYRIASNTQWKVITLGKDQRSKRIENLEATTYQFRLRASNYVGEGIATSIVEIELGCETKDCSGTENHDTKEEPLTESTSEPPPIKRPSPLSEKGIIIIASVVPAVVAIMVCVVCIVICRRRCNQNSDLNSSSAPLGAGNGHVTSGRPGNGHAHMIPVEGYGNVETITMEMSPMLPRIPENEQSDSKGGSEQLAPVNGMQLNGLLKMNHKNSGNYNLIGSHGDLNSSNNSEELQGLMAAMLASTDGSGVLIEGNSDKHLSSLDDIVRAADEEAGDQSSEDSGTGCRRAGLMSANMRACGPAESKSEDGASSPTSSPGGSSSGHTGSLGPHGHLSRDCFDQGRLVDEIGGVLIDRSTGAVIGVVASSLDSVEHGDAHRCENYTPNDGDSGHGSEVKSHNDGHGIVAGGRDTEDREVLSPAATPGEEVGRSSLLPPPPPPPVTFSAVAAEQLPVTSTCPTPQGSHHQHQRHHRPSGRRQPISASDLPPPPPPPPALAAANTTVTSELNPSSNTSSETLGGGQQQHQLKQADEPPHSGSTQQQHQHHNSTRSSRTVPSLTATQKHKNSAPSVAFSPPCSPPSPPHIA